MAPPLLTLQNVHLTFGGDALFEGVDLTVMERDRLCLVGRNGSGKSTLLKIAAGLVEADKGERFVKPGVTVRYLEQEPDLSGFASVGAYVEAGLDAGSDPYRGAYLLDHLGLSADREPTNLSGGEARRAAIARVLAPEPDILFMDEPTNHLDLPAIEWLEEELGSSRSAVVLISHDRRFLENLSRRTVWIDRGAARTLEKGFAHFETWRDELLDQESRERHKLERKIERENDWITYGVSARRKRNVRRLGELQTLREEKQRLTTRERDARATVTMSAAEAQTSGKQVIEAEGISKSYDGKAIVKNLSVKINRGDQLGIIGPNGAGKTTLLKLITGELEPDEGTVKLGTKLDIVTLDQRREHLAPTTTLSDALTEGRGDMVMVGDTQRHVIGYMKDFLFKPEQARTAIGALSGGERGRLMLARAFARPSNLMVLDEPTNDLDLETLDLLQELLSDYSGTVLLVSHDRDFLDRVVTGVLVSEGDGRWTPYAGGYSDMVAQRKADALAAKPAKDTKPKAKAKDAGESAVAAKKPSGSGLSFTEEHQLKKLPGEIEKIEKALGPLHEKLADPALFQKNPQEFDRLTREIGKLEEERAAKEELWLELEMRREEGA
ncbi:MAG: elongation factor 3 [Hyphomicrobiales bacterium]|nr:MAG: elongation factor 3 [Hyphomicrobiales bacterium]